MSTIEGPRGSGRLNAKPPTPKAASNATSAAPPQPELHATSPTDQATLAANVRAAGVEHLLGISDYEGALDPTAFNSLFLEDPRFPCQVPAGGGLPGAVGKAGDSKLSRDAGGLVQGLGVVPDASLLGQSVHDMSNQAHILFHDPESTIKLAHKIEHFFLTEEEGAEKAAREFVRGRISNVRALFGGRATGAVAEPAAAKPVVPPEGEQLTLPGMEPEEPAPSVPTGAGEPVAGGAAVAGEPLAAEAASETEQLTLPGMEEEAAEKPLSTIGKFAGGAAGIVGVLALPSLADEAYKGWGAIARGHVDEESVKAASKGTIGSVAAVGGIAEGAATASKVTGLAEGALPTLEAVGKIAGPAGGVLAAAQGVFDIHDGLEKHNDEQVAEGGLEVVGGGLMVASIACPPLAIVGGVVLVGTAIAKNRKKIVAAGKNAVAGAEIVGKAQLQAGEDLGRGVVKGAKEMGRGFATAGSDLVHGHVLTAAGDLAKGGLHAAADVAHGAVQGAEDLGSGIAHGVAKVFSGW